MIKKGDKSVNEIYKGDKIVQRVYLGNNHIVHERQPTINLLLDSKFEHNGTVWLHPTTPSWLPYFREENGITYCHPIHDWRCGQTIDTNATTFTFSALVRNTGDVPFQLLVNITTGKETYIDIPPNTDWHRIQVVITNANTFSSPRKLYLVVPEIKDKPYTIDITDVKLEEGVNSYPYWTRAPSEVDNDNPVNLFVDSKNGFILGGG